MMTEKRTKKLFKIVTAVFITVLIAVLSIKVCANAVPNWSFIENTVESIEDSKTTVLEFAAATTATAVAISLLPDDVASPVADSFAGMGKYFVLILMALFIERLIVVVGVKAAFVIVIPLACFLTLLGYFFKREVLRVFGTKLVILALALIFVIPCSVKLTNYFGAEYLEEVNQTIEATNNGADKINGEMASDSDDASVLDKLSEAFKTAVSGVKGLLEYFNSMIQRCMNSIVILIVTNFVMPILTLLVFRWLLKELFGVLMPTVPVKAVISRDDLKRSAELIEEE